MQVELKNHIRYLIEKQNRLKSKRELMLQVLLSLVLDLELAVL